MDYPHHQGLATCTASPRRILSPISRSSHMDICETQVRGVTLDSGLSNWETPELTFLGHKPMLNNTGKMFYSRQPKKMKTLNKHDLSQFLDRDVTKSVEIPNKLKKEQINFMKNNAF